MPPKKTTGTKHAVSKPKGVVATQKKQFTSKKATLASKGQGTAACESVFSFFVLLASNKSLLYLEVIGQVISYLFFVSFVSSLIFNLVSYT